MTTLGLTGTFTPEGEPGPDDAEELVEVVNELLDEWEGCGGLRLAIPEPPPVGFLICEAQDGGMAEEICEDADALMDSLEQDLHRVDSEMPTIRAWASTATLGQYVLYSKGIIVAVVKGG